MRELIVRQLRQRALTFERRDLWQTFPDPVQRHCGELVGHMLRACWMPRP
jgi:hypothetical protein